MSVVPQAERDEAVEAERVAGARGQARRARRGSARRWGTRAGLARAVVAWSSLEARALLDGIHQLAEAVAQLDARHVELEALGQARVARASCAPARPATPGSRRERRRGPSPRAPARPGRRARESSGPRRARPRRGSPARSSLRTARRRRRPSAARAAVARRRCGLRGVTRPPVTAATSCSVSRMTSSTPAFARYHSSIVNSGLCRSPDLAAPEARGDLVDALPAVGEQALHLVLGRGDEPARRPAVAARHLERVEVQVEPRRRHDDGRLRPRGSRARRRSRGPPRAPRRARAAASRGVPRARRESAEHHSASCPAARTRPPRSALPSAHVIAIPSSAPKIARAARCGETSPRSSPVACPSATTRGDGVEVRVELRRRVLLHELRRLPEDDGDDLGQVALTLEQPELQLDDAAQPAGGAVGAGSSVSRKASSARRGPRRARRAARPST